MNNDLTPMLLYTWVLMFLSGVFAYRSVVLLKARMDFHRRRKTFAYLNSSTEETRCKDVHSWDYANLSFSEIETGLHLTCKKCGFIFGTDYNLNSPALEIFLNNVKLRDERKIKQSAMLFRKQKLVDELMNRMIKANIESFDGDVHKNIESLKQFYRKTALGVECIFAELAKEDSDG